MGFVHKPSLVSAAAAAALWMGCDGGSGPPGMTGGATSVGLSTTGASPGTEGVTSGGSGDTSETSLGTSGSTAAAETESTSGSTGAGSTRGTTTDRAESSSSTGEPVEPPDPLWVNPNLWFSTESRLNYVEIDPADGTVVELVSSTVTTPMIDGQTGITMLESGALILSRESAAGTEIYYVEDPPTVASEIEVVVLGMVPDSLRIEALYTDCEGLVYLMDTGTDVVNTNGNRLIRFTGDYVAGDLSYEVITDLSIGNAPDIDDLGPGIDKDGEVTDGQGFAIDSGTVYDFNYTEGNGIALGSAGTFGVHVLGGPLFDDDTARLYIFDIDAQLFEADPATLDLSDVLVTGPGTIAGTPGGLSGITGPLTECVTTLPPPG